MKHRCDRCGWEWEVGTADVHDTHCPSPFDLGDTVWWDVFGLMPDLPPVRAIFVGLSDVVRDDDGKPAGATISLLRESVLKEQLEQQPLLARNQLEVPLVGCAPVERWPTLVIGEPT